MTAGPREIKIDADPLAGTEQELQTLSYALSHDFSASLRHMTSFSRLILADLGDGLTERQQLHADQLRLAGEQCTAMLEALFVYSRVQSRDLACSLHDPGPAVQGAWARLTAAARLEGAELSVAPLGAVYADAELLAQAVTAVLDNAIKFRRPGVALRVVVEPAHDRAFWRLRVSDNGVGVEARFHEAAFVMFRRLNSGDAYPGAGAGLAVCRRITRRHGGEARFVERADGACVELSIARALGRANRRLRTAPCPRQETS